MNARTPTVENLADSYLREGAQLHRFTRDTVRNHRGVLLSFARSLGDRPVSQIGEAHVRAWLASRHKLAAATLRRNLSTVRGFCHWLVRRGYLRRNPAIDIERIKIPRYLPRALPAPKVAKLLQTAPDARGVLICFWMIQEGLRCGEVSRLGIGDIDFQLRTVRVTGKGGHERVLPISEETWAALDAYLREHPATSGPLVRSYRQEWHSLAPDTISGIVSDWMSGAGIKRYRRDGVSAHALRHGMATDMLRNGAHLRDVQAALGHAHLATTETYLPLVVNDLRSAMGGRKYRP